MRSGHFIETLPDVVLYRPVLKRFCISFVRDFGLRIYICTSPKLSFFIFNHDVYISQRRTTMQLFIYYSAVSYLLSIYTIYTCGNCLVVAI